MYFFVSGLGVLLMLQFCGETQVEGKAWVRVDAEPDAEGKCKIVVGCNVAGKWVLHWGVSYDDEHGR